MSIPRLVVFPVLAAVFVLSATAQSPLAGDSTTPSSLLKPPDSSNRILVDQFRLPVSPSLESGSQKLKSGALLAFDSQTSKGPSLRSVTPEVAEKDSDSTCYSIRNYRMKRDDPHSDVTRPDGYSTCQPSMRFQVKSVEDSPELIKR
jgi:hypothetical protein